MSEWWLTNVEWLNPQKKNETKTEKVWMNARKKNETKTEKKYVWKKTNENRQKVWMNDNSKGRSSDRLNTWHDRGRRHSKIAPWYLVFSGCCHAKYRRGWSDSLCRLWFDATQKPDTKKRTFQRTNDSRWTVWCIVCAGCGVNRSWRISLVEKQRYRYNVVCLFWLLIVAFDVYACLLVWYGLLYFLSSSSICGNQEFSYWSSKLCAALSPTVSKNPLSLFQS